MRKLLTIIILLMSASICQGQEQKENVSPCWYGLDEAKTDVERFYALYNTHVAALELGVDVNYDGVDKLDIEIPADAKPIPLTSYNLFKNLVLNVKNNSKHFFLFEMVQPADSIVVDKEIIDKGHFESVKELRTGKFLLILKDDSLWVDQRQGYKYGHYRKDILYVEDGKAQNKPIMPYNTPETKLSAHFCPVNDYVKVVSGITINRDKSSKYKTYCFDIQNQYNVELCDIIVNTPESNLTADGVIRVNDCAKVTLDHIRINGTYSRTDRYGYGVVMDNVWKSEIIHLTSQSKWGIFGTNNINVAKLDNCDINRYDIHCYGRDVTIRNCIFNNLYNQFSSFYGQLTFEKCIFNNHVPVLIESTYNAFTPFDVEFKSCVFNINNRRNYIVDARNLTDTRNSRPELAKKSLPNITISKSTVNILEQTNRLYMFHFNNVTYKDKVGHLKRIRVKDLKVNGGQVTVKVGNKDFPHNKIEFPLYNQILGM